MICKKRLGHHHAMVVAATRDQTRDHMPDIESGVLAPRTPILLASEFLTSESRRRPDGATRPIDLERRARFARLSPEIV